MSPEQKDAILAATKAGLSNQLDGYYQELLQRIRDGESPRDAIRQINQKFPNEYASLLSPAFSAILGASLGSGEILSMKVSGLKLSDHLYTTFRSVSTNTLSVINDHLRGFQDARKLSLQIFEGFGFNNNEPLKISPRVRSLPRYLRRLVENPILQNEMQTYFSRILASQIKTPALKAAYLETLEAIENGAGQKVLENKLKVAFYERGRFFANRIAQTELHRAWVSKENQIIQNEPEIEFVRVTLSASHIITDICDLFSRQNKYGLGPGVYPKHLAPKPSYHPFCRCALVPALDIPTGTKWKERKGADRALLREFSTKDAARIMGSRAKLQSVLKGKDAIDVFNKQIDPFYRVKLAGDDDQQQPIIPVVEPKPPKKPASKAVYWDKDTDIGAWHEKSFANAPTRIKEIIRDGGKPAKVLATKGQHPHFKSRENIIDMGDYDKNTPLGQTAWTHEYGHLADYHYGRSQGMFGLWSAVGKFADAVKLDEKLLVKKRKEFVKWSSSDKFDMRTAINEMESLAPQDQNKMLSDRFKKSGLDFNDFTELVKKMTAIYETAEDGKVNRHFLSFIVGWERDEFEFMFRSIVGYGATSIRKAHELGYLGNMSDLVGSITANKVGGTRTGMGHEDRYYKKFSSAKQIEAFANIFSYYALNEPFLIQMMEKFAPNATKAFKEEFFK